MINTYSKRNTLTGFTLNKMVKEIYAVIEMPNEKAGGLRYQTFKGHAYLRVIVFSVCGLHRRRDVCSISHRFEALSAGHF
jgi:hypothetical protein